MEGVRGKLSLYGKGEKDTYLKLSVSMDLYTKIYLILLIPQNQNQKIVVTSSFDDNLLETKITFPKNPNITNQCDYIQSRETCCF